MKSRIKLAISTGLLAPLFVVAPAFALDNTTATQPTSVQSTSEQDAQTTATKKQEMQDRLQKRKDELKLKLTVVEQKRLQARCKGSQGSLKSVGGRITGIETSRTQVYGNLVDRLTKLQAKLDAKGADSAELKTEIATLQTKIDTFKTDFATYKTAVSDLSEMDCVTDPTAFKASLETARTTLKKVQDDSKDIKAYVNDTIKPTLKKIRATLDGGDKPAATTTTTTTKPDGEAN